MAGKHMLKFCIECPHVYIPLLFFSGVDYIDAPTPYMMGLHSGVDTAGLLMDGVVIVDLEKNCITTSEEIPAIPEPKMSSLRNEILKLLHPNVVWIDSMKADLQSHKQYAKPWSPQKDVHLRLLILLLLLYIDSSLINAIYPFLVSYYLQHVAFSKLNY
ncbi:putative cDENN domain, tripartite DENN domain, DENN domain lobe protein [Helianthus annuus]|nr:putative cDENN domain, tripartite DENN domain, DENN domain lobe protein [Helianthus annuus]